MVKHYIKIEAKSISPVQECHLEEEDLPEKGAITVLLRRPKCACNTACPDTLQPVCASDGNTVSE